MDPNELMCILELSDKQHDVVERVNDDFENHLNSVETEIILTSFCGQLSPESERDFNPCFNGRFK